MNISNNLADVPASATVRPDGWPTTRPDSPRINPFPQGLPLNNSDITNPPYVSMFLTGYNDGLVEGYIALNGPFLGVSINTNDKDGIALGIRTRSSRSDPSVGGHRIQLQHIEGEFDVGRARPAIQQENAPDLPEMFSRTEDGFRLRLTDGNLYLQKNGRHVEWSPDDDFYQGLATTSMPWRIHWAGKLSRLWFDPSTGCVIVAQPVVVRRWNIPRYWDGVHNIQRTSCYFGTGSEQDMAEHGVYMVYVLTPRMIDVILEQDGEDINEADAQPVSEHWSVVSAQQVDEEIKRQRAVLESHKRILAELGGRLVQLESGVAPVKQPTPTTTARGADLK